MLGKRPACQRWQTVLPRNMNNVASPVMEAAWLEPTVRYSSTWSDAIRLMMIFAFSPPAAESTAEDGPLFPRRKPFALLVS